MRVKITKREADSLVPGNIIADEEVRGFVPESYPAAQ
jgi:hypothetical protein